MQVVFYPIVCLRVVMASARPIRCSGHDSRAIVIGMKRGSPGVAAGGRAHCAAPLRDPDYSVAFYSALMGGACTDVLIGVLFVKTWPGDWEKERARAFLISIPGHGDRFASHSGFSSDYF